MFLIVIATRLRVSLNKGKPIARSGRKAMGLSQTGLEIAKLPVTLDLEPSKERTRV